MNPKEILGTYIVEADLGSLISGFSGFTGTNRNVLLTNNSFTLDLHIKNSRYSVTYSAVDFLINNVLNIKRFRVRTPLAPDLRVGLYNETKLSFQPFLIDGSAFGGKAFTLNVPYYNQWIECDYHYKPFEGATLSPGDIRYRLDTVQTATLFSVDDFNIQSDYLGETFQALLDLDIDTSGLYYKYTGGVI